jgi:hypothetical protein
MNGSSVYNIKVANLGMLCRVRPFWGEISDVEEFFVAHNIIP